MTFKSLFVCHSKSLMCRNSEIRVISGMLSGPLLVTMCMCIVIFYSWCYLSFLCPNTLDFMMMQKQNIPWAFLQWKECGRIHLAKLRFFFLFDLCDNVRGGDMYWISSKLMTTPVKRSKDYLWYNAGQLLIQQ